MAGVSGGGGARVAPPQLHGPGVESVDESMEFRPLEASPLLPGVGGGGGIRLPPPRLLGPGEQSVSDEAASAPLSRPVMDGKDATDFQLKGAL
eukprot:2950716-Prymnesium_polylepis.1